MGFGDTLKKLDALRLQQSVKATVQYNGRLSFTIEASKMMGLSEEKSLIVFEADNGDLGVTISEKGDPDAFVLKKNGPYFYIAFVNYLRRAKLDFRKDKIIYDIMELDEKLEGRTLYKFERRILPRDPKDASDQIDEDDDETQATPDAQTGANNKEGNKNLNPPSTTDKQE